ncbi:hypothetical protein [Pseudorhodoferax sp. Leaf267]|uniref:hypothetical protein n=1 Tax=Pseudorhodoferax sp. Leaf267 TaxID=1736316 RepID=UPI0012E1A85F|nr:hypothetical protein [Pseudorhodoferax sp. Leaf267]
MAGLQKFHEWQEAEHLASVAQDAISALIRQGGNPSQEQLDRAADLRVEASARQREMVRLAKADTQKPWL